LQLNFEYMKLSQLSQTLIGSEIVKLGGEIRERIRKGERIYNFTVGDFDPAIFPIPKALEDGIVDAYRQHFTNYPLGEGNLDLREAISRFTKDVQGLEYGTDEILVASRRAAPDLCGVPRRVRPGRQGDLCRAQLEQQPLYPFCRRAARGD
jgi:hypothetical protein